MDSRNRSYRFLGKLSRQIVVEKSGRSLAVQSEPGQAPELRMGWLIEAAQQILEPGDDSE
jgi:hypothetical protein